MNIQAFKYLQERIKNVSWGPLKQKKEPAKIAALRARLAEWDKQKHDELDERIEIRKQAVQVVKEVLFTGDYEKALEAVKRLESITF